MVGPISPAEIPEYKKVVVPAQVFKAFNNLITLNYCNKKSVVRQSDVINKIIDVFAKEGDASVTKELILAQGWLNIESAYESTGWTVQYDKPEYGETWEARFTFTEKTA